MPLRPSISFQIKYLGSLSGAGPLLMPSGCSRGIQAGEAAEPWLLRQMVWNHHLWAQTTEHTALSSVSSPARWSRYPRHPKAVVRSKGGGLGEAPSISQGRDTCWLRFGQEFEFKLFSSSFGQKHRPPLPSFTPGGRGQESAPDVWS